MRDKEHLILAGQRDLKTLSKKYQKKVVGIWGEKM